MYGRLTGLWSGFSLRRICLRMRAGPLRDACVPDLERGNPREFLRLN